MKGSYFLVININKGSTLKIGALGTIDFPKGSYVYVGSAMNNLEKRIQRHLSEKKKKHWHIDYLLDSKNAEIEKAFKKESPQKEECKVAHFFSERFPSIKNFGSSDCNCKSHLFVLGVFE